jgi:exosortase C (VPDSG-CTERM-specific)
MANPVLTETTDRPAAAAPSPETAPRGLWLAIGALVAAFGLSFYELVQLSLANSLYSHLPLIPAVSAYLIWMQRASLPARSAPHRPVAWGLLAAGVATMAAYLLVQQGERPLLRDDALAWQMYGFLLLLAGTCAWFLGRSLMRALVFPLGFLVFMAPFPVALHDALERFLQHGSADAAYAMISGAGTPILREGLIFHLPGIVLEVAPQCSGIRSSVALFITSIVAGYFFLHSPWKRTVLAVAVIPLAILRNGLRIFTLAQLCVHLGPEWINSFVHHRGGPIFFAISLVPFFLLLYLLYRSDRKKSGPARA